MSTYAIYDLETPYITSFGSYNIQDIFCISVKTYIDGKMSTTQVFTQDSVLNADGDFTDAMALINSCDYHVGHNSSRFDQVVVEQLGGVFTNRPFDTMLYAQVMYTKDDLMSMDYGIKDFPGGLYGNFGLKAFGIRLGQEQKIEFSDFSKLSEEQMFYCKADVDVTARLLIHILESPRLPNPQLMGLEHDCSHIISFLERDGFYMDRDKARKLSLDLQLELQSIQRAIAKVFKPLFLPDGKVQTTGKMIRRKMYIENKNYINKFTNCKPYGKPHKKYKSGKLKPIAKGAYKWFDKPMNVVFQEKSGEFQNIKLTKFSGTDNQIIKWLKQLYNYEFSTYTQKGNIRVDRDVLSAFAEQFADNATTEKAADILALTQLRRMMKIKKDLSQLSGTDNSLLSSQRVDGTITTRLNQNGTVTGRVSSSSVNMNQIPSSKEFRSLFTAPVMYEIPDEIYYKLMEITNNDELRDRETCTDNSKD